MMKGPFILGCPTDQRMFRMMAKELVMHHVPSSVVVCHQRRRVLYIVYSQGVFVVLLTIPGGQSVLECGCVWSKDRRSIRFSVSPYATNTRPFSFRGATLRSLRNTTGRLPLGAVRYGSISRASIISGVDLACFCADQRVSVFKVSHDPVLLAVLDLHKNNTGVCKRPAYKFYQQADRL